MRHQVADRNRTLADAGLCCTPGSPPGELSSDRSDWIPEGVVRMRSGTRWRVAVPVVLVAFVVGGCAGPASPDASTPAVAPLMEAPSDEALPGTTAQELDGLIEQWVADGNGTGVTAAVVSPAGSWSGAAGVDAAGMPLLPESAMSIANITKTFTAAQVVLLADEGLVDLDQPISDFVTLPFDTHGATVRQVLSMRSGFPVDPIDDIMAAVSTDPGRSWTRQDVFELIEPNPGRYGQLGVVAHGVGDTVGGGREGSVPAAGWKCEQPSWPKETYPS